MTKRRRTLKPALKHAAAGLLLDQVDRPLLADSSRSRKGSNGPRTTIKIPTQTSESLTFPAVLMRPIVHLVAQNGDYGFGDSGYECEGRLLICRRRRNCKTAVLWRLRAGDLRVCRFSFPVRQPARNCHPIRLATNCWRSHLTERISHLWKDTCPSPEST